MGYYTQITEVFVQTSNAKIKDCHQHEAINNFHSQIIKLYFQCCIVYKTNYTI